VRPNAAFQDNWCHHFLAEGVSLTAEPLLDAGEAINVALHPLADIPTLLASGAINQALVVSAFYWLGVHTGRR
jgi:hypothetical protein